MEKTRPEVCQPLRLTFVRVNVAHRALFAVFFLLVTTSCRDDVAVAPVSTTSQPGIDGGSERPLSRIAPPVDVVGTDSAIAQWPRIVPGVEARAVTSYDRTGGNEDGFSGAYSVLYDDPDGEHVIFDAFGPGALRTIWFTSDVDGNSPLGLGRVRFYFDDETTPRFDLDANDVFRGDVAPFSSPLVAQNHQSSGGFASWVPLVFRERLRITTEKRAGFYQVFYDTFPRDWDVTSTPANASPDEPLTRRFSATGFSSETLTPVSLDYTTTGAGTIDVLRFEPDVPTSADQMQNAHIRIWFDGADAPQVDVPLVLFFGSGLGETTIHAIPWTMESGRWESRFPMPYFEGVRFAIEGMTGKLSIHTGPALSPRSDVGTFTVIHSVSAPTTPDSDHVYADVTGAGKIVGTVLAVDPGLPSNKKWWEGDLSSFVDDRAYPNIHGTGHEDDHLGGWSNEFLERPFSLPMQGCPKTIILEAPPGGQVNAEATMYRLYPGIPFLRHVHHATEHGTNDNRQANYTSATFLYFQPRVRLVPSGAVATQPLSGTQRYQLPIEPTNVGVKLRRTYDAKLPQQRAHVVVDGVSIGPWYASDTIAGGPGTDDDLFISPQITAGKASIAIEITPETAFDLSHLEAWSVLP